MTFLAKLKSTLFPVKTTSTSSSSSHPKATRGTSTLAVPPPITTITPPTPITPTATPLDASTREAILAPRPPSPSAAPAAVMDSPAFDKSEVTVVFVLGGPGAGKGTQCARLVSEYHFVHLSAGDLLRAEQTRVGSAFGELIKTHIKEGKIVPMAVTIKLLENAMRESMLDQTKQKRFLIDGFPRQMDQAVKFDESVCESALVLFLTCPEAVLLERLLERGKTSGRDDDNEESIKKRFQTFITTSMPVVDYYKAKGKVIDIDSSKPIDDVYADIVKGIEGVLPSKSEVVA